jgi:hypothetical protein
LFKPILLNSTLSSSAAKLAKKKLFARGIARVEGDYKAELAQCPARVWDGVTVEKDVPSAVCKRG